MRLRWRAAPDLQAADERRELEREYWVRQASFLHRQLPWLSMAVVLTFAVLLLIDITSLDTLSQSTARAQAYLPGRLLGLVGAGLCLLMGFFPRAIGVPWSLSRLLLLCTTGTLSIAHASLVTYEGGGSPGTFPLVNFVAFVGMPLPLLWAGAGAAVTTGLFIVGLVAEGSLHTGGFEAAANAATLLVVTLLMRDFLNRREFRVFQSQEELREAREQTEAILLGILPRQIVDELKDHGTSRPRLHREVVVLFADLVSFSRYAEHLNPQQLVDKLDDLFTAFDAISRHHGLEKLKTIGDCYMAAGGLLNVNGAPAHACVSAALEMVRVARSQAPIPLPGGGTIPINIRVGIHCGPVVAGIIGKEKFLFDIWGDTVNMANRVETLGSPGEVTISREMWVKVKESFECEAVGVKVAKHDRKVDLFRVVGPLPGAGTP